MSLFISRMLARLKKKTLEMVRLKSKQIKEMRLGGILALDKEVGFLKGLLH